AGLEVGGAGASQVVLLVELHAGAHRRIVLTDVEADFAAVLEVEGFALGIELKLAGFRNHSVGFLTSAIVFSTCVWLCFIFPSPCHPKAVRYPSTTYTLASRCLAGCRYSPVRGCSASPCPKQKLRLVRIYHRAFLPVSQFPSGVEHQARPRLHFAKLNLADFVGLFVVVGVHPVEEKRHWHLVHCKIVVVRAVVEAVGVVGVVEAIVEVDFGVLLVGGLQYAVQLRRKLVGANNIHVVGLAFVGHVGAAYHVDVEV
nr:hypothetical protein [Tanacetum cinerariifolium]